MAKSYPSLRRAPRWPRRSSRPGGLPSTAAPVERRVGDQHDPKRIRYGCFLPDLTGLATVPPAPASRGGYIRSPAIRHKGSNLPDMTAETPYSAPIYSTLGVRTRINAAGALTRLGGAVMAPEVVAAMAA